MFDPSTGSRSRAWIEVRTDHLRANALRVEQALGARTRLVPMVKANAYGLGVGPVVQALRALPDPGRLWAFGVATVAEGEELRALGWTGPVLVSAPPPPGELRRAATADLTLSLSDLRSLEAWGRLARETGRPLAFHLEIDTGMGRAGLPWDTAAEWGPRVASVAAAGLRWEGCFTHFHSADEPDLAPTDEQWARFRTALGALPDTGGERLIHVANSAASVRRGGYACDLARPGIFLFGGRAGPGPAPLPVVSVRARLALVREVAPGSTVGYGATYRARGRERWGTVAIGYGDGIPRALSPAGGEFLVAGRRAPIVGRISMDVTTIDLTALPDARPGDVVTVIGRDGEGEITLDEVAARCGTISYEILTGLTPRLPRVYLEGEHGTPAGG